MVVEDIPLDNRSEASASLGSDDADLCLRMVTMADWISDCISDCISDWQSTENTQCEELVKKKHMPLVNN